MGANDDILAGEAGATQGAATGTAAATPPPALDSAAITKAVSDGLAGVDAKLGQFGQAIDQHVRGLLQGAQDRVARGTGSDADQDLTQQLLNPSQAKAAIKALVKETMTEDLAPYLTRDVQNKYEDQIDRQRTIIDGRYGPGSFDELILPEVEATVANTPNASAKGDKQYINSLVQLATGKFTTLDKLEAKRKEWTAKREAEDKDMDGGVLDAGRRRRTSQSVLTDEDKSFMAKVAEVTGEDIDLKKLEEVVKVMNKNGFLDSQVMPGVKNKLPVKGQRHSQKGAAA